MDIGIYADGTQYEQAYQKSIERNYKEKYRDILFSSLISTQKIESQQEEK